MFRNNLKLILRKLKREKLYAFVNILGLTVGLTAFLLIALYVRDELSFDRFHKNHETMYRVILDDEDWDPQPFITSDFVEFFSPEIPEVESYVRISGVSDATGGDVLLRNDNNDISSTKVFYTDPNFFKFFDFELVNSGKEGALNGDMYAVITEGLAERLFGDKDPIGESILINKEFEVIVASLAKNPPSNSTVQFELLIHKNDYFKNDFENSNGLRNVLTYIQLNPESSIEKVEAGINDSREIPPYRKWLEGRTFELLRFDQQRLHAPYERDFFSMNEIDLVMLFIAIGATTLALAIINYVNLITAQATRKVKEIGLRKVIGASKVQLITYQFVEATSFTLISFILAFAIVERSLPYLNTQLGKAISLDYFSSDFFIWIFVFGVLLGLISGLYPAFFIAKFKALSLVQRSEAQLGSKGYLRRFLVLFQFVASGILLVVLSIISEQMNYMENKDLGFDSNFLVSVPLFSDSTHLFQTVKNEISGISGVESVSINGFVMGSRTQTSISSHWDRESEGFMSSGVTGVYADGDFFETAGVEFVWKADQFDGYSLKEGQIVVGYSLAEKFNLIEDQAIKRLYRYNDKVGVEVVGIVKDFHIESLKAEIMPTIMFPLNDWGSRNILLKINPNDAQGTLAKVGEKYESLFDRPFEFYYLDDQIADFYKKEQGQFRLFKFFTSLAIFISLLGLVALTIFSLEQRRKEVSIRKVLGASVQRLILMLNREYSVLVIIAFIIASPIAYYAMQGWLQEFKYRISLSPLIFIGAFLGFLALSWLVTIAQSLKVTKENPADVLRDE